jgi:nucleotide-binding universal stress UspA family protein
MDASEGANAALQTAATLARDMNAKLTLLHVEAPSSSEPRLMPPPAARIESEIEDVGRWSSIASSLRGESVPVERATGETAAAIVEYARRTACDFVVMGSRARNRVSFALGSVAAKVAVQCPCPVVVVSPPA